MDILWQTHQGFLELPDHRLFQMSKKVKQFSLHALWQVLALDVGSQAEEDDAIGGSV